jgi:hypothetical protein
VAFSTKVEVIFEAYDSSKGNIYFETTEVVDEGETFYVPYNEEVYILAIPISGYTAELTRNGVSLGVAETSDVITANVTYGVILNVIPPENVTVAFDPYDNNGGTVYSNTTIVSNEGEL